MLSAKIEAYTIQSRFVLEEMDKAVFSNISNATNMVETKLECAHTF